MDKPAPPSGIATILHLSDLHLGESLDDIGEPQKASISGFVRRRRIEMQTHDPYIVAALNAEVKMAARSVAAPGEQFDFYVVTGDISTNSNSDARFEFARKVLTNRIAVSNSFSAGLGVASDQLLCVPGNHDVLFETTPERYLRAFGGLPAAPPYLLRASARNGRRFTFYGIDSNAYGEGNIAVGRVEPATLGWLAERLAEDGASDAIRILLLHHHPHDLNQFRSWSLRNLLLDRFTTLEEGERLLEACRARIDIVMHGHEHFPIAFRDELSGCIIVSAGTTCEWQSDIRHENSFHILAFRERTMDVVQFGWKTARFSEVKRWSFSLCGAADGVRGLLGP
jgi:3',5'-cyclic AMP phosphodiesterase CpdA